MDSIHVLQVSGQVPATTRQVYYTGTDALYEGYAVCYDVTASAANRDTYVAKPTLNNYAEFAGVVAPGQTIPARTSGGVWVNIISVEGAIARSVNVYTDENLVAGDLLGVIPGSFALGCTVVGRSVARVLTAVDRSTTAGVASVQFGFIEHILTPNDTGSRISRFFDHFHDVSWSATADAAKYVVTGTAAAVTLVDALAPSEQTDSTKSGSGIVSIAGANTGWEANMQLNGEPFGLAVGQNLFFRARIAVQSAGLGSGKYYFAGLNMSGTTDMGDACGTDAIGFRINNATLDFIYGKDQTSSAIQTATGFTAVTLTGVNTVVADTFVEVAFMVRNKSASSKELTIWVNGTSVTHTLVSANIVDNEALTLAFVAENSGAATALLVDRVEVNNYIG